MQHIFKTCLVSKALVSLCCLVGEDLGDPLGEGAGSLGGKATSIHQLKAGLGVLALSRKGSHIPWPAGSSYCGDISNRDKVSSLNGSPLRSWGPALSEFETEGREEGWCVWVSLGSCGYVAEGMCAVVCCVKWTR